MMLLAEPDVPPQLDQGVVTEAAHDDDDDDDDDDDGNGNGIGNGIGNALAQPVAAVQTPPPPSAPIVNSSLRETLVR
jgi:hypothetical protein